MSYIFGGGFSGGAPGTPRHWHITRGVKDRGQCAACDVEWAKFDEIDKRGFEETVTDRSPKTVTPPQPRVTEGDRSGDRKKANGHP